MPDLATFHQIVEHFQRVFDRREMRAGVVLVTKLAETIGIPIRPVQLIKIEIVGLQTTQAIADGPGEVGAVEMIAAATDMGQTIARRSRLAGQNPIATPTMALKEIAEEGFGGAV